MGTFAAGYSLVWLAVVAYLVRLERRQQQLQRQLESLRSRMDADSEFQDWTSRAA